MIKRDGPFKIMVRPSKGMLKRRRLKLARHAKKIDVSERCDILDLVAYRAKVARRQHEE